MEKPLEVEKKRVQHELQVVYSFACPTPNRAKFYRYEGQLVWYQCDECPHHCGCNYDKGFHLVEAKQLTLF